MTGFDQPFFARGKNIPTIALAVWLLLWVMCGLAASSTPLLLTPKWGRFEQSFKSSAGYANPLLEVSFSVQFVSPLGETNEVGGFWDGGQIWRVRFAPDLPGKWTFKTACSDATNAGLNNVTGEFLCTAAGGRTQFERHGPIRVARDHRHLEYTDQTPFLWLADTAWEGALRSKLKDWNDYAQFRAVQKFTVAQWIAAPGKDYRNLTAFADDQHLLINPEFFKDLDAKVEALDHAGLLSAIAPIWDLASRGRNDFDSLTDEQVTMLMRYMIARWGANNVAWILTCEGDNVGGKAKRWKRIGQQIFGGTPHALVVIFPGNTYWALDEFRTEPWVDVLGYQSGPEITEDSLQWQLVGPISTDWKRSPFHPVINLATPYELQTEGRPENAAASQSIRRAICWSLLNSPTAGVDYGAEGIWNWSEEVQKNSGTAKSTGAPAWQKAVLLPAGKQMTFIAEFFTSIDFWQLRPAPDLVANQPGLKSPARFIVAARAESQDFVVVYVPEDRNADLNPAGLPVAPTAAWVNPRTGERSLATPVVSGSSCRYTTPGPGDWLLWVKAIK